MSVSVAKAECIVTEPASGIKNIFGLSKKQKTPVIIEELQTIKEIEEFKKYINSMDDSLFQTQKTSKKNLKDLINEGIDSKIDDFYGIRLFKASINGKPCGLLSGEFSLQNAWINDFATWKTKPSEKINGIGKSLLSHFLNLSQKQNISKILFISISESFSKCNDFYKKAGFTLSRRGDIVADNLFVMNKNQIAESVQKLVKKTKYKVLQ